MPNYVVAIDQGTTGSTVAIMDETGHIVAKANREFPQYFPTPGRVEHEPSELYESVLNALDHALALAPPGAANRVVALGIANQRETTLLWDVETGVSVHPAIVWQDRRTAELCTNYKSHEGRVREVTGLLMDPYFSASKLSWLLDSDAAFRRGAETGQLRFGTVDSYLVERMGGGRRRGLSEPVIEVTNASRTMLMDIKALRWSPEMCQLWKIPSQVLPRIVPTVGEVTKTFGVPGLPDGIPICAMAGDQHAALFGQGCVQAGQAKCTYGTGAFVLMNTGNIPVFSSDGLLTTLAWQIDGNVAYALEGASFVAGAAVQWLRDGLGIITSSDETEEVARQVSSSEGVTFVPALAGLGAPYWDPDARGLICGITRGTTRAHLVRATLDAIAFQVDDLLGMMNHLLISEAKMALQHLRVDGGACRNGLLMQQQADLSGVRVDRPYETESTVRGAGLLAALGAGLFRTVEEATKAIQVETSFLPSLDEKERRDQRRRWDEAVRRTRVH